MKALIAVPKKEVAAKAAEVRKRNKRRKVARRTG